MIDPKAIKKYVDDNSQFLLHNKEIFDILEGELLPRIKAALRQQVLSDRSFKIACNFIPPINIIKRMKDKLSTIYNEAPVRTAEDPKDQLLLDYYSDMANSAFSEANGFFNTMKAVAVEPFLEKNLPKIRVISGHQCLPRSTNNINPLSMEQFIKLVGEIKVSDISKGLLFVYSNDDFIAIDTDGDPVAGYERYWNPLGIIPATYIKRSKNLLVPKADSDLLAMGVMIPSMIANLNYAAHMQGHSIIYAIDIDGENLEINPDSLWCLSTNPAGQKPEIGMLKPSVDVSEIWASISAQLQLWFETRGIRPGESTGTQNSLSGIALMIKEMDPAADIKQQTVYFREAEADFWQKLKICHNYWIDQGLIFDMPKFSEGFDPLIEFQELKAYENKDVVIDQQIKLVNELLTSRKRARYVIHKELSQEQMEELEQEIMEEIGVNESPIEEKKEDVEDTEDVDA
jgi:hypothetical protein